MATELGQAYVQIMPSAKGISGSIQKVLDPEASSAGKSAGSKLGTGLKVAMAAGIAATAAALGKTISKSLTEGAALQQSLGGIETLFKGSAGKMKQYANEAYKTVGLSANDYMENVTSFSASLLQSMGGDTEKAADKANMAMIDMGDNANKMGTSMGDIQNAYQGFAKQNYTMLDNLKLGYGGTKTEMERLLADATKISGVEYNIDNLGDVYDAIHVVQEELDITGTTAKESADTFSGSLASMKASFSNVLGNLSLGRDIGPSLNALAETTSTFFFGNFIPMVGNILKTLPSAVGTLLQAGFKEIFSQLGVDIDVDGIFGKIKSAFEPLKLIFSDLEVIFEAVGDMVKDFFQAFSGGASATSIIGTISDAINNLLTWISEGTLQVAQFMDNFKDSSAFQSFLGTVTNIIDNLKTGFGNLGSVVQNTLGTVFSQLPALFGTIVSAVMPVIDSITAGFAKLDFSGLQALASAVVPAITNAFSTMMAIVKPAIDNVISSFVSMWNAVQPLLSILADALMPVFQVIGSFLGGVFKGILMGVSAAFDGIKTVVGFLTPVISFLVDVFKAIAPALSKVAEWVGTVIGLFANLGGSGNSLKSILESAWGNIKSAVSAAGSGIKAVINTIKSIFSSAGSAGQALKSVLSTAWNAISSVILRVGNSISSVISRIKSVFSGLTSSGNSLRSGISAAWNGMRSAVSGAASGITGIVDRVKSVFSSIRNIDLSGAGSAIMDGFLGGLKSAWGSVKDFVGGIGSWIKEHKGPLSYDKKLLIPAGQAIMSGFNESLQDTFKNVQATVSSMAGSIADSFTDVNAPIRLIPDGMSDFNSQNLRAANVSNMLAGFNQFPDNSFDLAIDGGSAIVEVHVHANISGKELVKEIAEPVKVELEKIQTKESIIKTGRNK